jgi:hypothetical protein
MSTKKTAITPPLPLLKSGTPLIAARWWPGEWPGHRHGMIDPLGIFMYRVAPKLGLLVERGGRTRMTVRPGCWIVRGPNMALVGVCPDGQLGARFGSSVQRVGPEQETSGDPQQTL